MEILQFYLDAKVLQLRGKGKMEVNHVWLTITLVVPHKPHPMVFISLCSVLKFGLAF